MTKKSMGTILWCNNYKGYGEIETDSRKRVFFIISNISSNLNLQSTDKVSFSVGSEKLFGHPTAKNIEKLTRKQSKEKKQVESTL